MRKRCFLRIMGIFFVGAFLFLAGGCGVKNKPVPPASVVPEAIGDLRHTISDKGVQLTWSYPVRTVKGSIVEDISSFELFRAEIPLNAYCESCPVPYADPVTVEGGAPMDGKIRREVKYDSDLLRSGYKYFYKVRSRTSWLADSADSNVVTFIWFEPAAAPENVIAVSGDRQIALTWQPVTLKTAGTDFAVKYQIRRSLNGKDWTKIGEPLTATGYTDRQVGNGQKYHYSVQTLTAYKAELAEGGVSKAVIATPIDQTPPPAPSGVTAVQTAAGIKVFWDRSEIQDLSGYKVYRRTADQNTHEIIGTIEPTHTLFVDAKATEGTRYYYAVTALDGAKPANESAKSREATVRD
ncbi:MAG: hypothetical protein OEL83_00465 [Desulforhopalus sp.]|nr:hypothetical protein [Desulforhopalus sp.]